MVTSLRIPPRFVPTLTTVVDLSSRSLDLPAGDISGLEEQLLNRVLQRVDLSLEQCLSEAVSTVVQQQIDAMVPLLRQKIEESLRTLITEALVQELAENIGSVPTRALPSLG